jgi:hypothetical protein
MPPQRTLWSLVAWAVERWERTTILQFAGVLPRCSAATIVNIGLNLMRTSSLLALSKIDLLILLVGVAAFLIGALLLLEIAVSDASVVYEPDSQLLQRFQRWSRCGWEDGPVSQCPSPQKPPQKNKRPQIEMQ